MRASARLMRSRVGVVGEDGTGSSSSSSTSSARLAGFAELLEMVARLVGPGAPLAVVVINAWRRLNKVGVGDGGAAIATMPLGGSARVKLRSRLAGRRRLGSDEGATECCKVGTSKCAPVLDGRVLWMPPDAAAETALVLSSKARLPLGAVTGSIASSSLEDQSALRSLWG